MDKKKEISLEAFTVALNEHDEFCEYCEMPLYIQADGPNPRIYCEHCGFTEPLEKVICVARDLPIDHAERMVKAPLCVRHALRQEINGDLWMTDGVVAEIAGPLPFSYPDRKKFKKTNLISKLMGYMEKAEYQRATISPIYYKMETRYIAELKSKNQVTYIDDKYLNYIFQSVHEILIGGMHDPVIVKAKGKICKVIMPMSFDPSKITHYTNSAYIHPAEQEENNNA